MRRTNVFDELARQRKEIEHYKQQATEWQNKYYEVIKELKETKKCKREID